MCDAGNDDITCAMLSHDEMCDAENDDIKLCDVKHDEMCDAENDDIVRAMLSTMKCAMQRSMTLHVRC